MPRNWLLDWNEQKDDIAWLMMSTRKDGDDDDDGMEYSHRRDDTILSGIFMLFTQGKILDGRIYNKEKEIRWYSEKKESSSVRLAHFSPFPISFAHHTYKMLFAHSPPPARSSFLISSNAPGLIQLL